MQSQNITTTGRGPIRARELLRTDAILSRRTFVVVAQAQPQAPRGLVGTV